MTLDDAMLPLLQTGWSIVNRTPDYAVLGKRISRQGWNRSLLDVIAPGLRAREHRVTVTIEGDTALYNGSPVMPTDKDLDRYKVPLPPNQPKPVSPIASALATLQDLKDKNLITDDEYHAKRREILDRLSNE